MSRGSRIFQYGAGLGNVASYQVSGKPFVTGGIDVNSVTVDGPFEIRFPSVTQWIIVKNLTTDDNKTVKFAASAFGLETGEYCTVAEDRTSWRESRTPALKLKLSRLYLTGTATNVDVIAGLTGISTGSIFNNWSGSEGVG